MNFGLTLVGMFLLDMGSMYQLLSNVLIQQKMCLRDKKDTDLDGMIWGQFQYDQLCYYNIVHFCNLDKSHCPVFFAEENRIQLNTAR